MPAKQALRTLGHYYSGKCRCIVCVCVCVCWGGGGRGEFLTQHPKAVQISAHIAPLKHSLNADAMKRCTYQSDSRGGRRLRSPKGCSIRGSICPYLQSTRMPHHGTRETRGHHRRWHASIYMHVSVTGSRSVACAVRFRDAHCRHIDT